MTQPSANTQSVQTQSAQTQSAQTQTAQQQPKAAVVPTVAVQQPLPVQKAKLEESPKQDVHAQAQPDGDDEADSDSGYAPEAKSVSKGAKNNFYSFSDDEITSMRRRSREFKKLHDKLMTCTSKSEKTIARREQLRDRIISLQNTEYRTPKQDKELAKLRAEERKMLGSRGEDSKDCSELEGRLTEMLRGAYGAQGA